MVLEGKNPALGGSWAGYIILNGKVIKVIIMLFNKKKEVSDLTNISLKTSVYMKLYLYSEKENCDFSEAIIKLLDGVQL